MEKSSQVTEDKKPTKKIDLKIKRLEKVETTHAPSIRLTLTNTRPVRQDLAGPPVFSA